MHRLSPKFIDKRRFWEKIIDEQVLPEEDVSMFLFLIRHELIWKKLSLINFEKF